MDQAHGTDPSDGQQKSGKPGVVYKSQSFDQEDTMY